MLYKLTATQENNLLDQPETGMGYQVVEASKLGEYQRKFLVLNSEIVIDMDYNQSENIRKVMNEGIYLARVNTNYITLNAMVVLNEKQFRNIVNEFISENQRGATDNKIEYANGEEIFVRLSAFDDDKRIDKVNRCLRPGSFTTTMEDYFNCKVDNDDPVERYALPNDDKIKYAFHIQPKKTDTLQRGKVQPANNKRGGGKEVYFDLGTAFGTYLKQTAY